MPQSTSATDVLRGAPRVGMLRAERCAEMRKRLAGGAARGLMIATACLYARD
jgi:hypothetical protein